jgi:hypothetical protein
MILDINLLRPRQGVEEMMDAAATFLTTELGCGEPGSV